MVIAIVFFSIFYAGYRLLHNFTNFPELTQLKSRDHCYFFLFTKYAFSRKLGNKVSLEDTTVGYGVIKWTDGLGFIQIKILEQMVENSFFSDSSWKLLSYSDV